MEKKSKRKWSVIIVLILISILGIGCYAQYIYENRKMIDIKERCYWYNAEQDSFDGTYASVEMLLKDVGSGKEWHSEEMNSAECMVRIEGYEMSPESAIKIVCSEYDNWLMLWCLEQKFEVYPEETIPTVGYAYDIYLHKENKEKPECMKIRIYDSQSNEIAVGYCGENLEEAKVVQKHFE